MLYAWVAASADQSDCSALRAAHYPGTARAFGIRQRQQPGTLVEHRASLISISGQCVATLQKSHAGDPEWSGFGFLAWRSFRFTCSLILKSRGAEAVSVLSA
jgi:hypothetical protein